MIRLHSQEEHYKQQQLGTITAHHLCLTCANGAAGLRDFEITCLLDGVNRPDHCGCGDWSIALTGNEKEG